jgi:penicillin-binding protein 2
MDAYGEKRVVSSWRIACFALAALIGIIYLIVSLYHVQVVQTSGFSEDQLRQSLRRVQVPGPRGRVFDRNRVCLADNRPSYCIAFYVEELRQRGRWANTIRHVNAKIDELALTLGVPRQISEAAVTNHVMKTLPMPLLAWRDVSQETLAKWAELAGDFPGVDVYVQPERSYPYGSLAAHVIGYVKRDKPKEQKEPINGEMPERAHFYLPEMFGASGIELAYNAQLTGQLGEQSIQVDARGYKHSVWMGRPSVVGRDITLTLEVGVQHEVERMLRNRRGAGVVVDVRNGEILAMASSPTFDLNAFVPNIRAGIWEELNTDKQLPLFNRAIQGRYAPGSTFKPVTALAALHSPNFNVTETHVCNGVFSLGTMRLRCWNSYGHGEIGFLKAIEQSCNSYFCTIAQEIGYPAIYEQAKGLGLGRATGIDLPAENRGLLPTESWKEKNMGDRWRVGDTCQIGIGQGLLLTTPLQMAMLTAAVANGGKVYRPYLVAREGLPQVVMTNVWKAGTVEQVRQGMREVVMHGTGRRLALSGVNVAGKTGTAEIDVGGVRRKNTWTTAFAPFEDPQIAVVMVVEDGESGGQTVAPLVRQVMKTYFGEAAGEPVLATEPRVVEVVPDEEEPSEQPAHSGSERGD